VIGDDEYDASSDRYRPRMTRLLSGQDGVVYLDTNHPRVCIRGPEDRSRTGLGYLWLPDDQVFPYGEKTPPSSKCLENPALQTL
jgi:hypothetical protein